MNKFMNSRWTILSGAILVQLCIGTLYSWSLFNAPLMNTHAWTEKQVVLTFSIATFMFAFTTILSGYLLDRIGPRAVTFIGGVLYGGGFMLVSFASSLPALYLSYGAIAGAGVGFVYVSPLATLIKWFPLKKGLITGIVVSAFGLSSLLFKYVIEGLLSHYSLSHTFRILGVLFFILITLGSFVLSDPKEDSPSKDRSSEGPNLTSKEMVRSGYFYPLWVLYFLGCMTGLLVIGLAADLGIMLLGISASQAAMAVALIGLFNATGRIAWGMLSDKIGRIQVLIILFLLTSIATFLLGTIPLSFTLFFLFLSVIALCFGGFLSVFPAITEEAFGKEHFGSNYGIMYQAYGMAALTGPFLYGLLPSIESVFTAFSMVSSLGIVMSFSVLLSYKKRVPMTHS